MRVLRETIGVILLGRRSARTGLPPSVRRAVGAGICNKKLVDVPDQVGPVGAAAGAVGSIGGVVGQVPLGPEVNADFGQGRHGRSNRFRGMSMANVMLAAEPA